MSPGAFSGRYASLGRGLVLFGGTTLALAGAALLTTSFAFPAALGVGGTLPGLFVPGLFVLGSFGAAAGYGTTLLERSARA